MKVTQFAMDENKFVNAFVAIVKTLWMYLYVIRFTTEIILYRERIRIF